jgi:hypothetical protein
MNTASMGAVGLCLVLPKKHISRTPNSEPAWLRDEITLHAPPFLDNRKIWDCEFLATVQPINLSPDWTGTMKAVIKTMFVWTQGKAFGRKEEHVLYTTFRPANRNGRIVG